MKRDVQLAISTCIKLPSERWVDVPLPVKRIPFQLDQVDVSQPAPGEDTGLV